MKKTFVDDLAKKFSHAMHPHARAKGAALALGLGATVYGFGMGTIAIQADTYAKDTGTKFATAWNKIRTEYGNTWRNGTLGIIIGIYLLVEMGIGASKSESKHYSEFAIKRYLHDLHIDTSNMDSRVFRYIANLILANMTETERNDILSVGISVSNALDKNTLLSVSGDKTSAQGRIYRKKILIESKNIIATYIDRVIARNPALESLIISMLNGKTYFNPTIFNQKQR
jgi:hypothetical protein